MLSLKKAADTREVGWSVSTMKYAPDPAGHASKPLRSMRFAPAFDEVTAVPIEEGVPLAIIPSPMP